MKNSNNDADENLFNKFTFILNNLNKVGDSVGSLFKIGFYLGIMLLFQYFFSIKFVPPLDFQQLITIGFLSFLLGGIIILGLFFFLISGPLQWRNLLKNPVIFNLLITDKKIYSPKYIQDENFTVNDRLRILIFYILTMTFSALVLVTICIYGGKNIFWAIFLSGIIFTFLSVSNLDNKFNVKAKYLIQIFSALSTMFISGLIFLFGFLLTYYLISPDLVKADSLLAAYKILFVAIFLSSFCVITTLGKPFNLKRHLTFSLVILIFSFEILGINNKLCKIVLSHLNIGAMPHANIIVNQEGCEILSLYGYDIKCSAKKVLLKDITVNWNYGKYQITFYDKNKKKHDITLPVENVLSGEIL